MHIVSTNIGNPTKIVWKGKEIHTGIYKKPFNEGIFLGNMDVDNDSVIDRLYHGGTEKACYLFSAKHYPYWKVKYPLLEWDWGMFGENLTVSNYDEKESFIGDIIRIGTTLVQITQPRQPCFKLAYRFNNHKMVKQFVNSGHSGAYLKVLEKGFIQANDPFQLVERVQESVSVFNVFQLLYADLEKKDEAVTTINIPELAENCRYDLMKRFRLTWRE